MTTLLEPPPPAATPVRRTAADVVEALGVPADRVLVNPAPGTATEADCARCERPTELINATLVEKPVNNFSSAVAFRIAFHIQAFAIGRFVVRISMGDGSFRMSGGNLRLPDVGVTRAERLSGDLMAAVPDWVPDLAIEVLNPGNTAIEMETKRTEFFAAGVSEVWEIDPLGRTARVFRGGECVRSLGEDDTLDGGDVLPGFSLGLGGVIDEAAAGQ